MFAPLNALESALREFGVALPGAALDLSDAFREAGAHKLYIIVTTGRTGSTWLAEALKQVDGAGYPIEYFNEGVLPFYGSAKPGQSLSEFVSDLAVSRVDAGAFGFKIDPYRLTWLSKYIDIGATFPPSRCVWIYMRRWNLVKQAFSFARAKQSGCWHKYIFEGEAQAAAASRAPIADEDVWKNAAHILWQERWIESLFRTHKIEPLRIFYEELYDSRIDLLTRVLFAIDRNRDWGDLRHIRDATAKIAGEIDAEEEVAFLTRNISEVGKVMDERAKGSAGSG